MSNDQPYPNGRAVLSAIKEKAVAAHRSGLGTSVQSLIELAIFDRFLCRMFSAPDCPLGDHLEFRYLRHRDTGGRNQPELQAAAVAFSVTVRGAGTQNPINVDLAIHKRTPAAPLEKITPAFRLDLSRLGPVVDYQAIAVEDQIADKVCATLSMFGGQSSTRSKDLVDLAILTRTMPINAKQLRISVHTEALHRNLPTFISIVVPRSMTDGYSKVARTVPLLSDLLNPDDAISVVNAMLQPALSGDLMEGRWDPTHQQWVGLTD